MLPENAQKAKEAVIVSVGTDAATVINNLKARAAQLAQVEPGRTDITQPATNEQRNELERLALVICNINRMTHKKTHAVNVEALAKLHINMLAYAATATSEAVRKQSERRAHDVCSQYKFETRTTSATS